MPPELEPLDIAEPAAAGQLARRAKIALGWLGRIWPLLLVGCFVIWMTVLGDTYRKWVWTASEEGRFPGDIQRNVRFGNEALKIGWLNVYEDELAKDPPEGDRLDYPPLRLLTFEAWMAWEHRLHPNVRYWMPDYPYNAFLMEFSTTLEWLGAAAAFLIVHYWVRRTRKSALAGGDRLLSTWVGLIPATVAFLCAWFDPGVAIVGHVWPSSNVWAAPLYLCTVLLCLWDWWFVAGLVLGVGVHLSGQLMFPTAVFIIWPLAAGKPTRSFRWLSGFALGFALVVSGWMLTLRPNPAQDVRVLNLPALAWIASSLGLLAVLRFRKPLRQRLAWGWFLLPADAAVVLLTLPAILSHDNQVTAITLAAAITLASMFWFLPWSGLRFVLALAVAGCLLSCMPFFGASSVWWDIGFRYGTERFPVMTAGSVSNLPAVLHDLYGWQSIHDIVFTIPKHLWRGLPAQDVPVEMRQSLSGSFFVLLVVAAVAIGRQWRKGNRNLLVALVLPWVLFYTICPQMSPRYPVFIAGAGAICVGDSLGMLMLSLFFSALTLQQMCMSLRYLDIGPTLTAIVSPLTPSISWAVILAACVFFWVSCRTERRVAMGFKSSRVQGFRGGHLPLNP